MTFTINKKSWHYWLASKWGKFSPHVVSEQNICAYTRYVIGGLIGLILVSVLGSLFAYLAICAVVDLAWLVHHFKMSTYISGPGIAFLVAASLVAVIFIFGSALAWLTSMEVKDVSPTFVVKAYRSFKDKTCVRLNIV